MPSLIQKWNTLKDDDKDLFPLLEVSPHQTDYYYVTDIIIMFFLVFCIIVFVVGSHCPTVWVSSLL